MCAMQSQPVQTEPVSQHWHVVHHIKHSAACLAQVAAANNCRAIVELTMKDVDTSEAAAAEAAGACPYSSVQH